MSSSNPNPTELDEDGRWLILNALSAYRDMAQSNATASTANKREREVWWSTTTRALEMYDRIESADAIRLVTTA